MQTLTLPQTARQVLSELHAAADPEKATFLPKFFKTGPGQYGEGDQFIGVVVPRVRQISKQFTQLPEPELLNLLQSPIHEARLLSLFILIEQFRRGDAMCKKHIHQFYLTHSSSVNNWDLVDSSAQILIGEYISPTHLQFFRSLAKSSSLWEQRMSIVATQTYIRRGIAEPTFVVAEILLHHPHDLIHKAVGWMLREVGKYVGREVEIEFLDRHAATMPRTMLRYAIEHFAASQRKHYLGMKTAVKSSKT